MMPPKSVCTVCKFKALVYSFLCGLLTSLPEGILTLNFVFVVRWLLKTTIFKEIKMYHI